MPLMLLEHDAKTLLAQSGVRVPRGWLFNSCEEVACAPIPLPAIIKAQVPAGGRGKAGGIIRATAPSVATDTTRRLLGKTIKGHVVREIRIEEPAAGKECYLSLTLDPRAGLVRVLASDQGGMDVEQHASMGVSAGDAEFSQGCVEAAIRAIGAETGGSLEIALQSLAGPVSRAFFSFDALLLEINPLFVLPDGFAVAGDAKLVIDQNALPRNPQLAALVRKRARAYPEASLKLEHGFDFVVLDPDGELGLITTGAGLSMQLIDEIAARGFSAYNFCDIRTGQFRGDPARLITVLNWIAKGPKVRSVLMNFFAGVTHLGELSRLLVTALERVPQVGVPITVRLIGNGLDEAIEVLRGAPRRLAVEQDLERALSLALEPLARAPG